MSKKAQQLADKINSTPGAREIVIPILKGITTDNFSAVENPNSEVIQSIDELSKFHAQSLERIIEEIKKLNQMLSDGFKNDANYAKVSDKIKELGKERLVIKNRIMELPGNIEIASKLKSLRAEKKEKQLSLSDYLLELERMTGANQLELFDGTIYEIVKTAKLLKKKKL